MFNSISGLLKLPIREDFLNPPRTTKTTEKIIKDFDDLCEMAQIIGKANRNQPAREG